MFKKILIANRGEIALRIIRACQEMGIKTVAVYSEADKDSLPVLLADESIVIGKAPSNHSYLNVDAVIKAAKDTNADGIHPGYGFLSENYSFAKRCTDEGIKFIGPKPDHIKIMGNKSEAKKHMISAGVPVVPGSSQGTYDGESAFIIAMEIGFPVIIKASSGGGGRGMRIVFEPETFLKDFSLAKYEAEQAFNDGLMYVEKFLDKPRHVEIQILGDEHGNLIHLGERDCSIQRRNQKIIEEAPCQILKEEVRKRMNEAAIKAAKSVEYCNAGTVEFLLDNDQNFYFIEMNTRIQVEHPVTEMVTGVDIIKEQIKIAAGEKLSYKQEDIKIKGHAIECRINAEDCNQNFRPSPGKINEYFFPGGNGVRIDSHIYGGYVVPPYYDSMIGKLIVWAETREDAILRMKRSLQEITITGIFTNIEFHHQIMENEDFKNNQINTGFIDNEKSGVICPECGKKLNKDTLNKNMEVCHFCSYHFRISGRERVSLLVDKDSFIEMDAELSTIDYLSFPDYMDKVQATKKKTGEMEGLVSGIGSFHGEKSVICAMNPDFLMGSMGGVVGEKITRAIEYAIVNTLPLVIFSSSGGARMQEGIISLMQMAKTSAALGRLDEAKLLYVSVLTDPTTGGVTASFSMLGDVIIAEPKALIGFAGPRVIEQTIRQQLPEGFQRSEFLKEKGFIDSIISRSDMNEYLGTVLRYHRQGVKS